MRQSLSRTSFAPQKVRDRSAQGPDLDPQFLREQLRLFPRREVAALVDLMKIDQVGIGAAGPCLGRSIALLREHGDRYGKRDPIGLLRGRDRWASAFVLPVNPRC